MRSMDCHRLLHLIVQLRTDRNKIDLTSFNIESDLAGAGFFDLCPDPFEKFFFKLGHRGYGAEHRQHRKHLLQPLDIRCFISGSAGSPTSIIPINDSESSSDA